jgi:polyisoprenoid-binding protein YceI
MINRAFLLIIFTFLALALQAQRVKTKLLDSSWIEIKGETNVVNFSFRQDAKNFIEKTMDITATRQDNKVTLSKNLAAIEVKKFDSDDKMALHDFFELVKADKHPNITVKLDHFAYPNAKTDNESILWSPAVDINISVNINIAGVEKPYTIPAKVSRSGEKIEINGRKKIDIRDFGLTPPHKLFGLIKVKEWIEIVFKINLAITVED